MADKVGWFLVQVARPDLAAPVSAKIDAGFKNSLAETLTETEAAFNLSFVEMTSAILVAIRAVSWLVIGVILGVLANTMAMNARERLGEYAALKTMGFKAHHLAGLILGESLILSLVGGLLGLALSFPAVNFFPAEVTQYFPAMVVTRDDRGHRPGGLPGRRPPGRHHPGLASLPGADRRGVAEGGIDAKVR